MLHELKPVAGARSTRKRVGRGPGSGLGKTSGKGHKGQNARSGGRTRPGFEGGQLPLFQSIPKRGFKNINRKEYACVNLGDLNRFDEGTVVTLELLLENRMVSKPEAGLKILANGELDKKLVIKANKFSKSALEAIEKAGGTAEVI